MRTISEILFLLLFIIYFPTRICGQNNYTRHLEIISQAELLIQDKNLDEALHLLRLNEEIFQQDDFPQFLYNWFNGVILYWKEQYSEARPYILDAISVLDANLEKLYELDMANCLLIYYYAVDIDFRLGAQREILIEGLEHAKYIYEMADATSSPCYSRIITDLERLKMAPLCAEAMDNIASREYEQAIPQLLQIIEYAKNYEPAEYVKLVIWQKTLAMAFMNIGNYNSSERYYLSSLEILESHNLTNEKVYRQVLDALSVLYVQLRNYDKANLLNNKAKILYEEALDFSNDYVGCISNSALIQSEMGHNIVARMLLDVALRQAKKNLSDTLSLSIGFSDQFLEQPFDTSSFNKNFYTEVRIIPYVTLLSNSAVVYSNLGYFSDALKTIKESIKVSEEYGLEKSQPYNNLGYLYLEKSQYTQAAEWFLKGYDLCKTPYEADDIGMNAAFSLYLSKDSATAEFCSDFSVRMRDNIHEMFTFMSGEERAIYWKHFEHYLPIVNLFIYENRQLDYFGTIYDNILEAKGLLLRSTNAIRDAILTSDNDSDKLDFARICQLKQQLLIETKDTVRSALAKEIEGIDKRLTKHVNAYADFIMAQPIRWENVRDVLSNNDIAIEFYNIPLVWGLDSIQAMTGEPRYCAVILRKGYKFPHIIPLCKECQLEKLDNADLYETDIVYNLIWKPLEKELNGVKNIYFAADRELHKIGIEYAPMEDGKNIGDQYNIHRLSSTRVLAENRSPSKSDNAVLYGGLKYDMEKEDLISESRSGEYHPISASRAFTDENLRYGVKYLPGTLKEVEDISQSFTNPRIITDINGTEESFKSLAGTPIDIIHLATHGFFWSDEDAQKRDYVLFLKNNKSQQSSEDNALLRSGLFFSGANVGLMGDPLPDDVEDGVLTALELSNMNLGNVDMVVMSACESGLGETSGEGVFGLQRGFKLAGANTLLMSLWKVDDTATQLLMTEFYRNYLSGKSKQESLRLAQQYLRNYSDGEEDYSDPKYWAAFILLDALN